MKKIIYFFIPICIFIFSFKQLHSQNKEEWQPVYLLVNGGNMVSGVEAFFKLNNCDSESQVNIKLINHNEYDVTINWRDAVFTTESKWLIQEDSKKITLPAKTEAKGECMNKDNLPLNLKLMGITDQNNFKRYSMSELIVLPVK